MLQGVVHQPEIIVGTEHIQHVDGSLVRDFIAAESN